jgi:uncharacterized membrane protein
MGTEGSQPVGRLALCRVDQKGRRTTTAPLGSWWKHHHICLFIPWWRVPIRVYDVRLFVVSARTNKRHHHLEGRTLLGETLIQAHNIINMCVCVFLLLQYLLQSCSRGGTRGSVCVCVCVCVCSCTHTHTHTHTHTG